MATYFITAVRTGLVATPIAHEHITDVKLSHGTIWTREWVIAVIAAGHEVYTNASPADRVIVDRCPDCGAGSYITTAPDRTPENNLLHVSRF